MQLHHTSVFLLLHRYEVGQQQGDLNQDLTRMSGWPSGLRRQTQGGKPSRLRDFWSPNGGVGSNPTSDNSLTSETSLRDNPVTLLA